MTNKPKISPKTMKAADNIFSQFSKANNGDRDFVTLDEVAQIIDTATNLTGKEYALGELVERCERFKEYVAVPFTPRWQSTKDALYAAARNAKAALEDK